MGLFSKKAEEPEISQEILNSIRLSTLDYIPGCKVVKSFGTVSASCYATGGPNMFWAHKTLKTNAYKSNPECNAVIGIQSSYSAYKDGTWAYHAILLYGTAVCIEPER